MPGISSEVNAARTRTISCHHPLRESKQIHSLESKHERSDFHRIMNESTTHSRMGTDEKYKVIPGFGCGISKLCFVAINLAPRENWLTLRDTDYYDEVDVLYHNMCCDIMLFVPHQHSVMPQDVTLLSSVALLREQILNPYLLYCGLESNLYCNIVGGCEQKLI